MYLTDNNTNATVYVFPLTAQLQYTMQVGVTQMPIPLLNSPLLLNFSGGQPSVQVQWVITPGNVGYGTVLGGPGTPEGDFIQLTQSIQWGASTAGWTLWMPEVSTTGSTLSVQVFLYQLQVTYVAGQVNVYNAQATFYIGSIV